MDMDDGQKGGRERTLEEFLPGVAARTAASTADVKDVYKRPWIHSDHDKEHYLDTFEKTFQSVVTEYSRGDF